jgi:hypothetical protein
MKKKYVLHPGIVSSAAEGKCYFISASTLAYLHGVDFKECRMADPFNPARPDVGDVEEVHLYPGLEKREEGFSLIVTTESPEEQSLEKAA